MDKDFELFKQAVLVIIGDLDFERSLANAFQFLRKHFPLEAITIDQYSPERGGITVLTVTTGKGVFNVRAFVPLDAEANTYMRQRENVRPIINMADTGHSAITRAHNESLKSFFPLKPRGYLVGYLTLGNTWLGDLIFVGTRANCFTRRHEHLLGMLLAPFSLAINNRLHLKSLMASKKQADEERDRLRRELRQLSSMQLIGEEGGLKNVMESVHQLRGRDIPVLIQGETGTGKELVANAIQRLSRRSEARFIRVNCGALPESLLDSELFGYEKGSFTGAEKLKTGRFEQANGGTLFLDEVGELSLSAQVRLLRVLQDGIVERVGSESSTPVDVRVIAATNRDLAQMRNEGKFREDLYHRLNVLPIHIPPLRERSEDIPGLVEHFTQRLAARMEIPVPPPLPGSLERAQAYAWPGNVRELENIVERALILNPSGPLDISRYLPLPPKNAPQQDIAPALAGSDSRQQAAFVLDEASVRRIVDERLALALGTGQALPARPADSRAEPLAHGLAKAAGKAGAKSSAEALAASTEEGPELAPLDEVMAAHIRLALETCRGRIYGPDGAAQLLGLHHSTLRNKMKKLGVSVPRRKPSAG